MSVQSNRNVFYKRITVTETDFPGQAQIKLPFQATKVLIANDGSNATLAFSFLAPNIDGELFCSDGPLSLEGVGANRVWFKVAENEGNPVGVRIWAWRL